eukprot:scaffold2544_cov141-Isochrysis_galbana.AAC.2
MHASGAVAGAGHLSAIPGRAIAEQTFSHSHIHINTCPGTCFNPGAATSALVFRFWHLHLTPTAYAYGTMSISP